ncbi:MAG: hypothetical protein EXX96DRAFT_646212 [Benjaminiella poitrasii]|nr:MAG: hypothetical protein EXX96DRAFT_646212 [Benjaminiella poitrasii]
MEKKQKYSLCPHHDILNTVLWTAQKIHKAPAESTALSNSEEGPSSKRMRNRMVDYIWYKAYVCHCAGEKRKNKHRLGGLKRVLLIACFLLLSSSTESVLSQDDNALNDIIVSSQMEESGLIYDESRDREGRQKHTIDEFIIEEPATEYVDDNNKSDAQDSSESISKGTTTAHFIKFMNVLLDIMGLNEGL